MKKRNSFINREENEKVAYPYNNLLGRNVKVNRGGPECVRGRILAVDSDYMTIYCEGTVVYVKTNHIKSISETNGSSGSIGRVPVVSANNFCELLQRFRLKNVQINQGGPEKLQGVIAEVSNESLIIVCNNELVRVPIFHIKSVCLAQTNNKGNKSSGNKSNTGKSGGNKSGHSGGNKSGRSGGNKSGRSGGNKSGRSGGNKSGRSGSRSQSTGQKRKSRNK